MVTTLLLVLQAAGPGQITMEYDVRVPLLGRDNNCIVASAVRGWKIRSAITFPPVAPKMCRPAMSATCCCPTISAAGVVRRKRKLPLASVVAVAESVPLKVMVTPEMGLPAESTTRPAMR